MKYVSFLFFTHVLAGNAVSGLENVSQVSVIQNAKLLKRSMDNLWCITPVIYHYWLCWIELMWPEVQ